VEKYMTKHQNKLSRHASISTIKQLGERELSQARGGDGDPNPSPSTLTQQYVKNT
jgi:hypothetical protein